jgi:hypothetical protein
MKTSALLMLGALALAILLYLSLSAQLPVPGLTAEATYVGISFTSGIQTSSPQISRFNMNITVETYRTRISKITPSPTCTIRNYTRNCFKEKLGQYGATVQIYKTITISNNQTGQIYLQKTFNFTSGEDRKIETIITQPIPPNATLKIEIQIQITITTPTFTWTKTITKTITTTIGTTTKTEITTQ